MAVDIEKFVKHLRAAADPKPPGRGKCGEYVRKALQAGGAHFNEYSPPHYGKLYGLTLERLGFHEITVDDPDHFPFIRGDVMVMQPHKAANKPATLQDMTGTTGYRTLSRTTFGPGPLTAIKNRGHPMLSTVIRRIAAAILLAVSTTAAATGSDKPPSFLTVPVLGLRLPLPRGSVETFPEELRVKCGQVEDEYRTSRLWIFGRAKDAAKTYYVLTGYSTRRNPELGQRLYEYWNDGVVFAVQGDKCGGDGAEETFDVRDPDAENDGNVPIPILGALAVDLAARTVKAFGGADQLRTEIKNQRIDFNKLSPELQKAFKPYFDFGSNKRWSKVKWKYSQ